MLLIPIGCVINLCSFLFVPAHQSEAGWAGFSFLFSIASVHSTKNFGPSITANRMSPSLLPCYDAFLQQLQRYFNKQKDPPAGSALCYMWSITDRHISQASSESTINSATARKKPLFGTLCPIIRSPLCGRYIPGVVHFRSALPVLDSSDRFPATLC
jgi:hypothetical protein